MCGLVVEHYPDKHKALGSNLSAAKTALGWFSKPEVGPGTEMFNTAALKGVSCRQGLTVVPKACGSSFFLNSHLWKAAESIQLDM